MSCRRPAMDERNVIWTMKLLGKTRVETTGGAGNC